VLTTPSLVPAVGVQVVLDEGVSVIALAQSSLAGWANAKLMEKTDATVSRKKTFLTTLVLSIKVAFSLYAVLYLKPVKIPGKKYLKSGTVVVMINR
jgi:hypothetical protein